MDGTHPSGRQHVQDRLGDVGVAQLVRALEQDAGNIDGDVARPDHRGLLGVQDELIQSAVGVSAVPVDEIGGREAAGQVLPGNSHPAIDGGTGGIDHGVMSACQIRTGKVRAELHTAQEVDVGVFQDLTQGADHALDLEVVRSNAVAHQTVGGGQSVHDVDVDRDLLLPGQGLGRVDPRGS